MICQAPKLSVTGGYGVDSVVVVVVVLLVVVFRNGNGSRFSEVIRYDVSVVVGVDEVGSFLGVKDDLVDPVVVLDGNCFVAETVVVVEGVVTVDVVDVVVFFVVMNPCLIFS